MPIPSKPLFRADVLRQKLAAFTLPSSLKGNQDTLAKWRDLIQSGTIDSFKEEAILPDFVEAFFRGMLGYTNPADNPVRHTLSRNSTSRSAASSPMPRSAFLGRAGLSLSEFSKARGRSIRSTSRTRAERFPPWSKPTTMP